MFAGQVTVEEVKGDKDIEVGAGKITISSIHDGDYRNVDASVSVGEVQARAFDRFSPQSDSRRPLNLHHDLTNAFVLN